MTTRRTFASLSLATCAAVFFATLSGGAAAFAVKDITVEGHVFKGMPVHEEITRTALKHMKVPRSSGGDIAFEPEALTEIANANWHADSKYMAVPHRHFDAELFGPAQKFLVDARKAIVMSLKDPKKSGYDARVLLGEALHTVQDFYSHSTWIENRFPALAPLGETDSSGSPITVPYTFGNHTSMCTDNGPITVPGQPLTTGFYDAENLIFGANSYLFFNINLDRKCGHGRSTACNNHSECPGADLATNGSAGINKDTPLRDNHLAAILYASDATKKYVDLIISDLGDNDAAKCRLMVIGGCSNTHWQGDYTISRSDHPPAPGGDWYWPYPPQALLQFGFGFAGVSHGRFHFDDESSEVIFDGLNYQGVPVIRSMASLSWRSTAQELRHAIPTRMHLVRNYRLPEGGYGIDSIDTSGSISYKFLVLTRGQTFINGTFIATMQSVYFDNGDTTDKWHIAEARASGNWSAALVNSPKPKTQMNGYDYCWFDNTGYMKLGIPNDKTNPDVLPGADQWSPAPNGCRFQ